MKRALCITGLLVCISAWAQQERHPLTKAIDYDAHLLLLTDLQPNSSQLMAILTAARAARQAVTGYEAERKQAATANADDFKQQAKSLAEGTPVDEKVAAAIAAYHDAQRQSHAKLLAAVDAQISQVRRRLAPEQTRLIDWSRPPEVNAVGDDQALTDELRQLLSRVTETERVLERIRYLIPSDYSITRTGRLEEFLRPYVRPNTPEFKQAMDFLFRLTDETRIVSEQDWPQQAPLFAARVLQYLGALEPSRQAGAARPYAWWDLYDLLTDEQTPALLQQILAANGNPAE